VIFLLAGLVVFTVGALVAQAAVHSASVRKLVAAHTSERGNLIAALLARTPGEYAGLINAGRPRTPKPPVDPERQLPPEATRPIGL
jgi:hypothetical protein